MLDRLKIIDLPAAMGAGLAGGAAYLLAMEADLRLTGNQVDDLKLLGRPFVRNPARARAVGLLVHTLNATNLAVAYALLAHDRLTGPPWWRGVLFANVENALLYPLTRLENHHPGIRDGQIDRYWTRTAFLQSIVRHLAYGAVLGAAYARLRRRGSPALTR
ncbi:MAG: hypothetical protein M3R02_26715 [Chloroflexota bacterium]|nr:hypothetical protein [Chloroflexota bacterium]